MSAIALNQDGTATLTLTAADTAKFPLGFLTLTLTIWASTSSHTGTTVAGRLEIVGSGRSSDTQAGSWAGDYFSVAATETIVVQGSEMTTTLTISEDGGAVSPDWVDWRLHHSPQGSVTPITTTLVPTPYIAGVITYSGDEGNLPWEGVSVYLALTLGDYESIIAQTTTTTDGAYTFAPDVCPAIGTSVVVWVDEQSAPDESTQSGSRTVALASGLNVVNVACTQV